MPPRFPDIDALSTSITLIEYKKNAILGIKQRIDPGGV